MAVNAKKLPSGSWRCQITVGYETRPDGSRKVIRKSFTNSDPTRVGKKACEMEAAQYLANMPKVSTTAQNFGQCVAEYIEMKTNVLSPTTIRYYRGLLRTCYADLLNVPVHKITSAQVQKVVNMYAAGHSPKTVRNMYGLITAVMSLYAPSVRLSVTLPQAEEPKTNTPTDFEVEAIIRHFRASDDVDMLRAVYLAAFGTLRRSEVCAVYAEDLKGNRLHVTRAMVYTSDGEWVVKTTKTAGSQRWVYLPDFVCDVLPWKGRLVNLQPTQVYGRFKKACRDLGLRDLRFHDLRHYAASVMHALGIPDVYIQRQGGWQSNKVLDRVYKDVMPEYDQMFMSTASRHFESVNGTCPHEIPHAIKKSTENRA